MRTALFLCALGAAPVTATASGNPLADLVLGLTRDVLNAAFNGAAGASVRPSGSLRALRARAFAARPNAPTPQRCGIT